MSDSLDALEALLKFRKTVTRNGYFYPRPDPRSHPEVPVPDPLNPYLPHYIESDVPSGPGYDDDDVDDEPYAPGDVAIEFANGLNSAMDVVDAAAIAASVPNPLRASLPDHQPPVEAKPSVSALKLAATHRRHALAAQAFLAETGTSSSSSAPSRTTISTSHGFHVKMEPASVALTSSVALRLPQDRHVGTVVRTEKVRDALNSKPQRGKKRKNLNEFERLELTRTRNREHAKSTRQKKKQRFQELLEIEKQWHITNELNTNRRNHLAEFIEQSNDSISFGSCNQANCLAELKRLAGEKLLNAEFSIMGSTSESVALSAQNSGSVKVLALGKDVSTGRVTTLLCVVCVDFVPNSTEISSASLSWLASPHPTGEESVAMFFPSVSASSFET